MHLHENLLVWHKYLSDLLTIHSRSHYICFCIMEIFTPIHIPKRKIQVICNTLTFINKDAQTLCVSSHKKTIKHTPNAMERAGNLGISVSCNPYTWSGWILVEEVVSSRDPWITLNEISVKFNHFLACSKMLMGKILQSCEFWTSYIFKRGKDGIQLKKSGYMH